MPPRSQREGIAILSSPKREPPKSWAFEEMGVVRLLTREGEVALAKQIERGEMLVSKAVSRSPFVLRELTNCCRR